MTPARQATAGSDQSAMAGTIRARMAAFAGALRAAGLRVGAAEVMNALRAVDLLGMPRQSDWYWALQAVFVRHAQDRARFAALFREFWLQGQGGSAALAPPHRIGIPSPTEQAQDAGNMASDGQAEPVRTHAAFTPGAAGEGSSRPGRTRERSSRALYSAIEVPAGTDIAQMSDAQLQAARRAAHTLAGSLRRRPTRRHRPDVSGTRIDRRASLRATLRAGGEITLLRSRRCRNPRPVVVLCDVSGSMTPYVSVLVHFLHALARNRDVRVFLFGTALRDVTRILRRPNGPQMLAHVNPRSAGWGSGTRIGDSVRTFRRHWSRRTGASEAEVLLITDGLDLGTGEQLEREMARLARTSHRIVWLNPLLKFPDYAPLTTAARAIARHAHETRPIHNLASIGDMIAALAGRGPETTPRMPRQHRSEAAARWGTMQGNDHPAGAMAPGGQ